MVRFFVLSRGVPAGQRWPRRSPVLLPSIWSIAATMEPSIEIALRFGFALAVFAILAAWELLAPRRRLSVGRSRAAVRTSASSRVDAPLVRLLVPARCSGCRALRRRPRHRPVPLPGTCRPSIAFVLLGFLFLDLALHAQHQRAPPRAVGCGGCTACMTPTSTSTSAPGLRFHPFEILISLGNQDRDHLGVRHSAGGGVRVRSGAQRHIAVQPLHGVVCGAGSTALCGSHRGDVRHAPRAPFDRGAREHDSNFGFNLPWWDRLFRHLPAARLWPATTA